MSDGNQIYDGPNFDEENPDNVPESPSNDVTSTCGKWQVKEKETDFMSETPDSTHCVERQETDFASRPCHLGEPGTEQFEVVTRVGAKEVHRLKLHDPFVRTTTTLKGIGHAWRCLTRKGLQVVTCVNGSHGVMREVMTLNPRKMESVSSLISTLHASRVSAEGQESPLSSTPVNDSKEKEQKI